MSSRSTRAVQVRRAVLTTVATVLVGVAEVGAVLSAAGTGRSPGRTHAATRTPQLAPTPGSQQYGEPQIPSSSRAPAAPSRVANRFVRDYALWSRGRLPSLPAEDATPRVMRLLEQRGRVATETASNPVESVRIEPGLGGYVATSIVGNFVIGRRGSRWVVVSLPGD